MADMSGVTHFTTTMFRVRTGEGTPVNRNDDPQAKAILDSPVRSESANATQENRPQASEIATPSVVSKETRRFDGHEAIVWSVRFSPDGSRALSGSGGQIRNGGLTHGSDFTVRLWDVATGQQLQCFTGHQHFVQSVAFTPDARQAIGAGKIWAWRRWDIETGQELPGFTGEIGRPFFHLTLSRDASRLLSFGGKDKVLRLWDMTAASELWNVEGFAEEVSATAFSADGQHLATAGGGTYDTARGSLKPGSDHGIRIWNAISGKEEFRLRGHFSFVRGLAFLPDGRRMISAGADNVLRLWDLQTRKELRVFPGHTRPVNAIDVSHDGRWALSGSADATVRLWDIESGNELCRYEGHTSEVQAVAVSTDRRFAISGGYDETVRLWQLPEPEK
jgi:WD40 repeat protein